MADWIIFGALFFAYLLASDAVDAWKETSDARSQARIAEAEARIAEAKFYGSADDGEPSETPLVFTRPE